tara:strand:- start:473 stop:5947 length:5475 start_codon:yes stop_codon:yes gene_type:complete
MVLRFTSGDGSEQIRRLKAIASGGIVSSSDDSGSSFGKSTAISHTFSKTAQLLGAGSNVIMTQPMFFSPLHTPQNWQIASKRREIYQWARFYYENEPKVAAGVDFYAQFPLNGFTLECKNRRILKYFEQFIKDINLSQILRYIAHEYFLLGDVFPFLEITCPKCFPRNTMVLTDGGNKPIQDIEIGDQVLTIEGEYKAVTARMARKYDGAMVRIKMQSLPDLESTDTHKHYVVRPEYRPDNRVKYADWNNPQQIEARNILPGDYIASPYMGFLKDDVKKITFDGRKYRKKNKEQSKVFTIPVDEEFAHLMGWYVAEGSTDSNRTLSFSLNGITEQEVGQKLAGLTKEYLGCDLELKPHWHAKDTVLTVSGYSREVSAWLDEQCGHGSENKRIPWFIMRASKEAKQSFLNAYLSGDGHVREDRNEHSITTVSRNACFDLISLLGSLGHSCFVSEKEESVDSLGINRRHCYTVSWRIKEKKANGQGTHREDNTIFFKVKEVHNEEQDTVVYNMTVDEHHNYVAGSVFTRNCHGGGIDTDTNDQCNHPDGTFNRVVILNPDYIDAQGAVLGNDPTISLVPDEELKSVISRRWPAEVFEKIPPHIIDLIQMGRPIQLSNRSVSHIRLNASPYGTFGTSILRRLFTILAYKTKLMTANWIVAERMILPIRVVKVGEKDRPATDDDIADIQNQLATIANDPNLTLVTHHAFDYEWYGACHDATTEILTTYGWKKFYEIDENEIVATYNAENKEMQFQQIQEYHEYDFESTDTLKMFHFDARSVDICVTPNHRMLVERGGKMMEIYSQEVQHDDKFLSQVDWTGRIPADLPYQDSPVSHLSLDEYLEFVGYYISEGGAKEERRKNLVKEKQIQACSIGQNKTSEHYQPIRDSVGKVYPNFSEFEDQRNAGKHCLMTINSAKIARYLATEFGSHSWNKKIPRWIKNLPQDKLRIFYDAMVAGDGYERNDMLTPRYGYATTSEQLADDWSEICMKMGYWPKTGQEKPANENCRPVYRIYWSEKRTETKFNIREQHIKREDYSGKVYCVKVPNTWIITRRNGHVTVQGNTGKIHNITNELEQIGKEILDGLMLNQAILNGEAPGYNCHDEETLTLTDSGFKYWNEITEKDKIACYNPETDEIEYHHYIEKHVYDHDGEMIHFKNNMVDILVTPNHRMWNKKKDHDEYEFIEARNVKRRSYFKSRVAGFDGDDIPYITIGDETYDMVDFCKFVGWYVAEGSLAEEKRASRKQELTTVVIHQSKSESKDDIVCLFDSMFENSYETKQGVNTYKPELAKWLSENCGRHSYYKKIPVWMKNLSSKYLDHLLSSYLEGDGSIDKRDSNGRYWTAYTSSDQLSNDISEIAFKCGWSVSRSKKTAKQANKLRKYNQLGAEIVTRKDQHIICLSKGRKGNDVILDSRDQEYQGNEIHPEHYSGKVYCFTIPHGLFITKRNDKITVQGNSAAVGVEILISRLDSWRDQLAEWVHKHLFLPIAMMQGFIDEEETNMMGRSVFLYPTIKWNDLNLRDNSNKVQIMMQGYDKGMVSAQSILEEMNLDYDTEIQRIREEQIVQGAAGLMGQGGMGDMGMGGGMGGMSGFGGPPPGGDMGMGMGMGGDMGMGGAPGGDMGMGGAPGGGMGGGMGAAAGGQPPFISKRGKGTAPGDEQQSPQVQLVKLTSLERKMLQMLQSSPIPYGLFAQYKVALPGEQQPFLIDFAYPQVGVGVEADGQMWHENAEMKQRDNERDNKLAGAGWRILRFREDAITDKANMIQDIVYENVVEAAEEHKQRYRKAAESDNPFIKVSSTEDFFEEVDMNRLNITYLPMPDGLGEVVFFDTE